MSKNYNISADLELMAQTLKKLREETAAVDMCRVRAEELSNQMKQMWHGEAALTLYHRMEKNRSLVNALHESLRFGEAALTVALQIYQENEQSVLAALQAVKE